MKKALVLLALLFTLPSFSYEIYNDGNYSFELDDVMILRGGRELYYDLYVIPLANTRINDRYYKVTITHFVSNGYTNISKMYALDAKGNYLHTDNTKDLIKAKIKNYSVTLGNNILNTFTSCKEELQYLYCKPST